MVPECSSDCGIDVAALGVHECADVIERDGARLRAAVMAVDEHRLRTKPDAATWSAMEYLVHVRDLVRYHGWLANKALTEQSPEVPAPNPDAVAANESYNDAPLADTVAALAAQIERFTTRVRSFDEAELDRAVVRGERALTVRYMVGNVAHEVHHHLGDVERLLG